MGGNALVLLLEAIITFLFFLDGKETTSQKSKKAKVFGK